MDKKLKAYIEYIEKESEHPSKELLEYHLTMLQHFQHERHMHLIVTLFFALYMIIFFGGFIFISIFAPSSNSGIEMLQICAGIIEVMLVVTVVFYSAHYYKLENGCQVLEEITKKLYKRD